MQNNPSEEYNILVNWLIHQHNRHNHHIITFLTINLILIALINLLEDIRILYFIALVIVGIIILLLLLKISSLITKEEELRFAQAREMEYLFRSSIGGIFRTGYELFSESKAKYYKKANKEIKPPKYFRKINVKKAILISHLLLIAIYLSLAVLKILDP